MKILLSPYKHARFSRVPLSLLQRGSKHFYESLEKHKKSGSKDPHIFIINGVPYGIRTRVAAVKGRCPRPLDERDIYVRFEGIHFLTSGEMKIKQKILSFKILWSRAIDLAIFIGTQLAFSF